MIKTIIIVLFLEFMFLDIIFRYCVIVHNQYINIYIYIYIYIIIGTKIVAIININILINMAIYFVAVWFNH